MDANQLKELRKLSGAGLMDCKEALLETKSDVEKAVTLLRKKGLAKASKHHGKETGEGRVFSYIHTGGTVGVLLSLACQTDFVANTDDFQLLGKDLCMQIAATNPVAIAADKVDEKMISQEKEIIAEQIAQEMKAKKKTSPEIIEKISEGKLKKFFKESCLLEQSFIKDEKKKVHELIDQVIAKLGENIQVTQYSRFQIK